MLQVLYTETMNRAITAITITAISAILLAWAPSTAYAGNGIEVDIDIKPGSDPNSINTRSMGLVPVAILSSAGFDATQVDVSTLTFNPGQASPKHNGHLEDVNGDGLIDLVTHYVQKDTGIQIGHTQACLSGQTFGGQGIGGCDSIVTVPP